MKRKISLATLFILGAVPLWAIAAESSGPTATGNAPVATTALTREEPAPLFVQLDVNHDSYVTRDEAKRSAEVTSRFKALDINQDGKIGIAEFKTGMQPKY